MVKENGTVEIQALDAIDLAKFLHGEDWEKTISIRTNDKYIRPNLHGVSYG